MRININLMLKLTVDQVKALAPDPASFKSGQGLADERHWTNLGSNASVIWGECKGSGKEPYKVRLDLSNNGSACTCPSHKFPCKHVLGLMLMCATAPSQLKDIRPPAWVTDWLEKRLARAQATARRTESKVGPETRQKEAVRRAEKREKLAQGGIEALERWIRDFAHLGLAFAQTAQPAFWDEQTARMVDAQLPGAARCIREMSALPGSRSDWAERVLLSLGRLYSLVQAYRTLDTLPFATQQDVRTLLGWNVDQEALVAATPGIQDDWMVLDSRTEEDEKTGLRTQVNWLWGKFSQRPAQILNFAYRTQPLDTSLVPGLVMRGELVFFPGAVSLRAVFKEKHGIGEVFTPGGFSTWTVFLEEYAAALGRNPWLETFPLVLDNALPLPVEQTWFLRDSQKRALPLAPQFTAPWEFYALSGGRPLTVFGLWDGFFLTPRGAWEGKRYVRL